MVLVEDFTLQPVPSEYRKEGFDWVVLYNPKVKKALDITAEGRTIGHARSTHTQGGPSKFLSDVMAETTELSISISDLISRWYLRTFESPPRVCRSGVSVAAREGEGRLEVTALSP